MNVIKLLAGAVIMSASQASYAAQDEITYYCSQGSVNSQYQVTMGEIKSVQVHDGPFMLLSTESDLSLAKNYLRSELDKVDLPSACKEYLISQAGFATYSEGELIARVYFEFDRSSLTKESLYILDQLENDLKLGSTSLLIEGHTDSLGDESYNMRLGLSRAKAVENHLLTLGAEAGDLTISSLGESDPIANNDVNEGRAKNRRVDLSIYD
ncbi:hypothetical protein ST37_12315 [Vibrio sp. qd031]|uniref:OmpA family protein n=1 Tax=Vibrio sp. qd031 TaxID=1603038 RepID=UPI000A0FAA05|nr:OmpA family protein [Vibrio sp. qd031]ORT49222.1 hypothetical protein ST37_12315 [Vibrio sp. qd031]